MNPKIYTRTGDKGLTSLYGGKRVDKFDQRVVAYGTVDELNSALGVVIAHLKTGSKETAILASVQSDLFVIGAHLAGGKQSLTTIIKRVSEMESFIDELDVKLPPLKNFILPGGSTSASFAHLARSICRRAEREVVRLSKIEGNVDTHVIVYLNRLSDLLFELSRFLNHKSNIVDTVWKSTD